MTKSSASSQRGRQRIRRFRNIKVNSKKVDQEIKALMRLREDEIDTSDIPEVKDWSKAVVGKFYRPRKEPVTIRLDADVIAWLKAEGPGYQTRINMLLRREMKPKRPSSGSSRRVMSRQR